MSVANDIYNLDGLFGLCSGYWDKKSKIFKQSDNVEKEDCCLRTCKPFVDECVKECSKAASNDSKLCYKLCKDMKEICEDNCLLSSDILGINNPIHKGAAEFGCGDGIYTKYDMDCLLKNKDNIIKYCQSHCLSTQDVDCTHHCYWSYNLITNKNANPLYFDVNSNVNAQYPSVKSNRGGQNNSQYIIYALPVIGIIFGFYILLILIRRK